MLQGRQQKSDDISVKSYSQNTSGAGADSDLVTIQLEDTAEILTVNKKFIEKVNDIN